MMDAMAVLVLVILVMVVLGLLRGQPEVAICVHCCQVIECSTTEEDAWFHAADGLAACHAGLGTTATPDRTVFL